MPKEPVRRWIFHTTPDREIHNGPEADCRICLRRKNKQLVTKVQTSGKFCKQCDKPLRLQNTTGFCITCLHQQRTQDAVARHPKKSCTGCGKRVDQRNKTGFCIACRSEKRKGTECSATT